MANRLCVTRTKFIDTVDGSETLGYRVYDDYFAAYCNILDVIPEDDGELIKTVMEYADENTQEAIRDCIEVGNGVDIDNEYYSASWLKHRWREVQKAILSKYRR